MNVRELIEKLDDYGDHVEVYATDRPYRDHDYWHEFSFSTEVVNGVTSVVIGLEGRVDEEA
jgi:hypothetical protein